jgi:hypothetical protein
MQAIAAHRKLADNNTAINRLHVAYDKIIKLLQVPQSSSSINFVFNSKEKALIRKPKRPAARFSQS